MSQFAFKPYYRRNLPHIQPEGAILFVTSRLANSLPREAIERLHQEKERLGQELEKITDVEEHRKLKDLKSDCLFDEWDAALVASKTSVRYLSDPRVARIVSDSLHYRQNKVYDLIAYCIMPNHLHLVFTPLEDQDGKYYSLSNIMHSLKRHTALQANHILGHEGPFWQHENYDHVVRDQAELERIVQYVLYNPVKAGLTEAWQDWKWSYSKCEL